jgi:hypothetical protein
LCSWMVVGPRRPGRGWRLARQALLFR